jgi:hypothetical protein
MIETKQEQTNTLPADDSFDSEKFIAKVQRIKELFEKNEPGRFEYNVFTGRTGE